MLSSVATVKAAGRTDPGRQRAVNEDRVHVDAARGVFMVIDGVGGQAAGGKAADVALSTIRTRLEGDTGSPAARIRDALTVANNEIHRLAATRPEWNGMACVATVVVLEGSRVTVGHVGDTRLYKLSRTGIEKITRDHSPVGEREDAGEISEREAMLHARRNEVYRDLGSDRHGPGDPDFIDVIQLAFDDDAAMLLCSDGLTDLIDSTLIQRVVRDAAGDPDRVAAALVDAANTAGGKDNVTVVYVEGEKFRPAPAASPVPRRGRTVSRFLRVALLTLVAGLLAVSVGELPPQSRNAAVDHQPPGPAANRAGQLVVRAGESISDALRLAAPGVEVVVEPGEYREALSLPSHVRLVSGVPAGAVLRLPATARETDAAVVASGVSGAALVGFRIVGDAASALGTGLLVQDSEVSILDTEISGATSVAVDIVGASRVDMMASRLHDNPGAALAVRPGASARIAHNVFKRNGGSIHTAAPVIVGGTLDVQVADNMFFDATPAAFAALGEPARSAIARDNWFFEARAPRPPALRPRGTRQ